MDLLEPGGRKFVELGSGSPPEEEGADAAITPETLSKSLLTLSLFPQNSLFRISEMRNKGWPEREKTHMYVQCLNYVKTTDAQLSDTDL